MRTQMRQKWATTTGQITPKDNLLRVVHRQLIQDGTEGHTSNVPKSCFDQEIALQTTTTTTALQEEF
jgi:hypothetical protein